MLHLDAVTGLMVDGIGPDVILTANRVMVGTLFTLSGYWKAFTATSHANLVAELQSRHIPYPQQQAWLVASVELLAGAALVVGLFTVVSALGLLVICIVACASDPEKPKGNLADRVGDYLWKQDVLYAMAAAIIIGNGSGPYSFDAILTLTIGG